MSALARNTARPQDEEEISEDMLAAIPEIDGETQPAPKSTSPFAGFQAKKPGTHSSPASLAAPADISAMLQEIRHQMEASFAQQLDRVETSFAGILKDMEGRLAFAQAELDAARRENERVRADHERKVETLRELKKTLEKL